MPALGAKPTILTMVRITTSLILTASLSVLVSAIPAQNEKRAVVSVHKGTSGNPFTAKDVLNRDLARIAVYNNKSRSLSERASNGPTFNEDVTYIAKVSFCSQTFDLIVDTGSSNTWVRVVIFVKFPRISLIYHSAWTGWRWRCSVIILRYQYW